MIFTKIKVRLCDLFMLCGLCYLMIATRRQVTMFALICSMILNRMLVELSKIYTKESIEVATKK